MTPSGCICHTLYIYTRVKVWSIYGLPFLARKTLGTLSSAHKLNLVSRLMTVMFYLPKIKVWPILFYQIKSGRFKHAQFNWSNILENTW